MKRYYAAREIHRREERIYSHQPQFIIGAILFIAPLLVLLFSDVLSTAWKLLLLPVIFGFVCLRDTVSEHYCLLLLRQSRQPQIGEHRTPADQPRSASTWEVTRAKGKSKFILQNGIFLWGGFMFIVTTAADVGDHRPVTALWIFFRACLSVILGAFFGWGVWSRSEAHISEVPSR